jgi:hypothetical protein
MKTFTQRIANTRKRLEKLKALNAPKQVIKNEEKLLKKLIAQDPARN